MSGPLLRIFNTVFCLSALNEKVQRKATRWTCGRCRNTAIQDLISVSNTFNERDFLFCLVLNVPVNSYGHAVTVSSPLDPIYWVRGLPNHTCFPSQAWLTGYPVLRAHNFACNWQQPFLNQWKGGKWPLKLFHDWSLRKYGSGQTSDHCICSQTYLLLPVGISPF